MTPTASPRQVDLVVRDLGRMPYAEAFALQKDLQREVIEARACRNDSALMYLLLVEHDPPVITVSRRRGAKGHLVAGEQELVAAGVEVAETDRGGDITCHGPGQLVVYPILDLNVLGLRLHGYMRFLEQVVIDGLARFGIAGHRDPSATGVWVSTASSSLPPLPAREGVGGRVVPQGPAARKICAMGVRVSRWVSMHGLALNVTTNLDHFNLIVPCGLVGRTVTSLERELGDACPEMEEVKHALVDEIRKASAVSVQA